MKQNKKIERLSIRLSKKEKEFIKKQAKKENMTISEYVLFMIGVIDEKI